MLVFTMVFGIHFNFTYSNVNSSDKFFPGLYSVEKTKMRKIWGFIPTKKAKNKTQLGIYSIGKVEIRYD